MKIFTYLFEHEYFTIVSVMCALDREHAGKLLAEKHPDWDKGTFELQCWGLAEPDMTARLYLYLDPVRGHRFGGGTVPLVEEPLPLTTDSHPIGHASGRASTSVGALLRVSG